MLTVHLTDEDIDNIISATNAYPKLTVLGMKLQAIRRGHASDSVIEKLAVPEADHIGYGTCGNVRCDHLHLILYNQNDEPIASASCGEQMLRGMLSVLRDR